MFITYKEIERIKRIDLPQLFQSKGINLTGNNGSYKALCPFHKDTNPSLSLSRKGGIWVWHCFGCNSGGTAIDFVMKYEGVSFPKAIRKLSRLDLGVIPAPSTNYLSKIVEFYHNTLKEKDKGGIEYLTKRCIADTEIIDRFKIGYANGSLVKVLPKDKEIISKLIEIGVLNDKGNEFFYNCITFPITDENNEVIGLYGRNIELPNHLYLKGPHRGVFNWECIKVYPEIIITESIIDCLSLYKLGYRNTAPIYGTNGLTESHINLFRKHNTKKIILCLDNDKSGKEASNRLIDRLKILEIPITTLQLPQNIKDPNELLQKQPSKTVLDELFKTETMLCSAESAKLPIKNHGLINYADDQAEFKFNGITYIIRGMKLTEADNLRLIVNAQKDDRRHIDRFDLYSDKSRQIFMNKCAEKLGTSSDEIEDHLLSIIKQIELIQEKIKEEGLNRKETQELTEEEKRIGLSLLKSEDILTEVENDLTMLGYVGEPLNKKIVYLTATSRLLNKPLSCIMVSQSGAGKSYLSEKIEEMMPAEQVESYSRITPQSLYYMEKYSLVHKLVIIEERDGMIEANYPIRTLQSRKKLTLAAPIKDPATGKTRTVRFEVYGPIAHIETTTRYNINPENSSRCFILHLDESEYQTRLIQEQQNKSKSLDALEKEYIKQEIIKKHNIAQRMLRQIKVVIPYQQYINFPAKWITTRRYNEQFLSLIEAVTFLNQYKREPKYTAKGIEYIESGIEDYKTAYNLAKVILNQSMDELTKSARELLNELKTKPAEENGFTRRNITEWTGWPYHKVKESVRTLVEMEYLSADNTTKGSTQHYKLNPYTFNYTEHILKELTTPEELCSKIGQKMEKVGKTGLQLVNSL